MSKQFDVAVIIGRWQLPFEAQRIVIDAAFAMASHVVIVLGSAYQSRSPVNPFREFERIDMLESMLTPQQLSSSSFLLARDESEDSQWAAGIFNQVHGTSRAVVVVGANVGPPRHYQTLFPKWDVLTLDSTETDVSAHALLSKYFSADEAVRDSLSSYVPAAVLAYLESWRSLPRYRETQAEYQALATYKARYPGPYYLTADSLVELNGHVLLIKRDGAIGKGQWALPGGFIDEGETFYEAALRELIEETALALPLMEVASSLQAQAVFDAPERSPRGRLITQAFHFKLPARPSLPTVAGSDDAQHAAWVPISDLGPALEMELFEDHADIIHHFIPFRK